MVWRTGHRLLGAGDWNRVLAVTEKEELAETKEVPPGRKRKASAVFNTNSLLRFFKPSVDSKHADRSNSEQDGSIHLAQILIDLVFALI